MRDADPLAGAVSRFGASPEPKLSGKGAADAPEDQPRAPLERPVADVAAALPFKPGDIVWEPIAASGASGAAVVSACPCRLLRDEVAEQSALGTAALTGLAGPGPTPGPPQVGWSDIPILYWRGSAAWSSAIRSSTTSTSPSPPSGAPPPALTRSTGSAGCP